MKKESPNAKVLQSCILIANHKDDLDSMDYAAAFLCTKISSRKITIQSVVSTWKLLFIKIVAGLEH